MTSGLFHGIRPAAVIAEGDSEPGFIALAKTDLQVYGSSAYQDGGYYGASDIAAMFFPLSRGSGWETNRTMFIDKVYRVSSSPGRVTITLRSSVSFSLVFSLSFATSCKVTGVGENRRIRLQIYISFMTR